MNHTGSIIEWIQSSKTGIEAAILVLFGILLICLIVKALAGRGRKVMERIDSKLEDIQGAVTELKAEQERTAATILADQERSAVSPPISITADGKEVRISIGSADEESVIKAAPEEEPEQPEAPAEPEQPEQPAEPEPVPVTEPGEPEVHEPERAAAVEPEQPAEPEKPAEPEAPAEPEPEPEQPEAPEEPEQPAEPEPEQPEQPEAPAEPEPPEEVFREVELDLENRDEIDLSFGEGVEPVVNIYTDNTEGFEPGEHTISLRDGEVKEFLLAGDDLIKVLVPEEPEEKAGEPGPEEPRQPGEPEPEEAEPAEAEWKVPGWRELNGTLDLEFEPIQTIELAFDTPSGSTAEKVPKAEIKEAAPQSGRRSTDAVRESFEASYRRGSNDAEALSGAVRSFATDKHGNTYTEQSLIDQIK